MSYGDEARREVSLDALRRASEEYVARRAARRTETQTIVEDAETRTLARYAFNAGCAHIREVYGLNTSRGTKTADAEAAIKRFPSPTVTRYYERRFLAGPAWAPGGDAVMAAFRWVGDQLQTQHVRASDESREDKWLFCTAVHAAHVAELAELKKRPTFEVSE